MSSTFSIALSGLQAESNAINTTGNNLANMNTSGFKVSQVNFKDLFSQVLQGGYQSGLGVEQPVSQQVFSQGGLQTSNAPLASAIRGDGFFVVKSPTNGQLFTRDGNFIADSDGVLRTQTGEAVQGWTKGSNGTVSTTGPTSDIILPAGAVLAPNATTTFSINGNLDAEGVAGTASGNFSAPMQVIDALGNPHDLTINFTRSSTNASVWNYDITIPGEDLASGTAGTQVSLLSSPGSVTFNSDGTLSNAGGTAPVPVQISGLADDAADMNMTWTLWDAKGKPQLTQYSGVSNLASSDQDGNQPAQRVSVGIQSGGQVVAVYSNGQQRVEAQLALAEVENPESMQSVGNNNLAVTSLTATPVIGAPSSGGRGEILGQVIEGSNVDMATEFTHLIVYQSAYQAASKVITTASDMNRTLFDLIH